MRGGGREVSEEGGGVIRVSGCHCEQRKSWTSW